MKTGTTKRSETIPAGEFKQTCLKLIDRVKTTGVPIVITKRGKPVAQLAPLAPEDRELQWPTELQQRARILGDIVVPASEPSEWEALSD